jgi:hypothetical protein
VGEIDLLDMAEPGVNTVRFLALNAGGLIMSGGRKLLESGVTAFAGVRAEISCGGPY